MGYRHGDEAVSQLKRRVFTPANCRYLFGTATIGSSATGNIRVDDEAPLESLLARDRAPSYIARPAGCGDIVVSCGGLDLRSERSLTSRDLSARHDRQNPFALPNYRKTRRRGHGRSVQG